jgi:hypothetical protein
MIRKLLLLLVVITILQNTSYSQQGEVLVQTFFANAGSGSCGPNSIVVRIALRNNTANTVDLAGIRYGIQYNAAAVTLTGITSYMNNGAAGPGLDDATFHNDPVGPDSGPTGTDDGTRVATVTSNGTTKTMTKKYYNRSTSDCDQVWLLPPNTYRVAVDFCFQLVEPKQPSDYGLTNTPWGYGTPQYITQVLTSPTQNLTDPNKEIGVYLHTGAQDKNNPYQPFDLNNCNNQNINPFTIGSGVNIISPVNGILSGKATDLKLQDKENSVLIQWKSENNQLVDYFEVQRKDNSSEFKTIGLVMSTDVPTSETYEFKDKITARDVEPSYRIKVFNKDREITYSDVKKIRLGSEQSISVKVFPNPSSANIRINLPAVENGSMFVCRMYSTEGRIVKVTNVSSANPSVDITSLSVGSYFMELYHPKSGKRFYTQFSKQ